MATIAEIVTLFRADTKDFEAGSKRVQQGIDQTSLSLRGLGEGFMRAGALISGFVTAPIAAISEMGRSFEKTLRQVAANTAMTDAQLNQMRDTIISMGRNTSASMEELAKGYMHVTNFGFEAADATRILDAAMKDAVATGAQTEAVANTLAGVLHEFGLSGLEASNVMNTLALAAAHGNLTLEQFTAVSGRVFSTAANLGLGLGEAAAAMSALTRAGFPAAQASTQLVGALTHLVNPTGAAKDEIVKLSKATGVDLVHDFSQAGLQSKGLSGILVDLKRAIGDNTAEALKLFGGIRGGLGVMALMGNAQKDYKQLLNETSETMAGKLSPTTQAYNREIQSLSFQFGELKNKLTILGDELNKSFSGSQVNFIKELNNAVDALTRGFASLDPTMKAAVTTFLGAFALGGPILLGVGALVTLMGGPLTIAIVGVTAALSVLAADWASTFNQMEGSSQKTRQALGELAGALGMIMDMLGAVANAAIAMTLPMIGAVKALSQALTGDLDGAWRTVSQTQDNVSRAWQNSWAELNGKWQNTLSKMVADGFAAADDFARAGRADGAAYHSALNQALGGGLSLTTPLDKFAAPAAPKTFDQAAMEGGARITGAAVGKALTDGIAGGIKKHGGGVSKAIVDMFQGDGGFDRALDLIRANVSKLPALLDPATKQFKAQGQQMEKALTEVAKNINDFLSAAGVSAKITTTDLINNWSKFQTLISKTDAFEHLKDALNQLNLDRVAAGFAALDATIKVNGDALDISALAFEKLKEKFPGVTNELAKVGLKVHEVFPAVKVELGDVADRADETGKQINHYGDIWLEAMIKASRAVKDHAPSLKESLRELKEAVESSFVFDTAKVANDAAQWIDGIIKVFEEQGERMGKSGEALSQFAIDGFYKTLAEIAKIKPEAAAQMQAVADAQVEAYKKSLYRLPGVWDEVFNKLGSTTKSWAAAIFGVLDTIPGKFGDIARKAESTINTWVSFFDKILGLLSKFSNSIPSSIGDALSKVLAIFKGKGGGDSFDKILNDYLKTGTSAFTGVGTAAGKSSSTISSAVTGMSEKVKTGFGIAAGAAAGFASSLAITANSSSKAMGFLEATISSTLAGIAAGFAFGPVAGAITAGVSLLGGIIGLFHKKSPAQAEQERLNNEKLKADIAASAQATMNAALEGFQKALAFLDQLDQFTAPRKEKFRSFFKQLSKLMDFFVELAKKFQGENLEKDKAVAEAIGAVAQGLAAAPAAFDAINSSFTIPDTQFDIFFSNLDRFMARFFARADVWIDGASKRAMKVADRLKSVVDIISPFAQGMKDLVDLKPIGDDALNALDDGLQKLVTRIGAIADKFDKGWLKTLAYFSEKASAALGLWKDAVDAIKATVDVPTLDPTAVDNIVGNIELFITKLVAAAESISAESLGKAASIANSILPIANAIKAWAEAAKVVHDYSAVANDTWDAIVNDFNRAILLINMMLASAIDFLPKAVLFEDVMKKIADHLKAGLAALGDGLVAAASAFGGVVLALGGGVPIGTGPGGDLGGLGGGGSLAPMSASGTTVYQYHYHGTVIHEKQFDDTVRQSQTSNSRRRLG